jgi:hypothetical protein
MLLLCSVSFHIFNTSSAFVWAQIRELIVACTSPGYPFSHISTILQPPAYLPDSSWFYYIVLTPIWYTSSPRSIPPNGCSLLTFTTAHYRAHLASGTPASRSESKLGNKNTKLNVLETQYRLTAFRSPYCLASQGNSLWRTIDPQNLRCRTITLT